LALLWVALTYRAPRVVWWEAVLVGLAAAVALVRVGNAWLDALALLAPLAMRFRDVQVTRPTLARLSVVCLFVTVAAAAASRPPSLPVAATEAVLRQAGSGRVVSDWRWAPQLQRDLGPGRAVLGGEGIYSEPSAYWLDYVKITQAHYRWDAILRALDADMVVLESGSAQRAAADAIRASATWRVVFDGEGALVATRVGV
jgi:hypothetical protein